MGAGTTDELNIVSPPVFNSLGSPPGSGETAFIHTSDLPDSSSDLSAVVCVCFFLIAPAKMALR